MPRSRRRAERTRTSSPVIPMVYDGYYGGFVPVEAASFDVSVSPEAVVALPLSVLDEQRVAAEREERRSRAAAARRARGRRAGPRMG